MGWKSHGKLGSREKILNWALCTFFHTLFPAVLNFLGARQGTFCVTLDFTLEDTKKTQYFSQGNGSEFLWLLLDMILWWIYRVHYMCKKLTLLPIFSKQNKHYSIIQQIENLYKMPGSVLGVNKSVMNPAWSSRPWGAHYLSGEQRHQLC